MGAHLLGVHLLLDESVNQLLLILVNQLLALVPDGARKVAAHKLDLALNLVNGCLIIEPLVDDTDGKLTHFTRDRVVQGCSNLDRFKGNRWDGVRSDLMVHTEAELITDHIWRVFLDDHIDELVSVLVDQLDALFVDRGGQAVAEDVKSLLDLRLVGLVLDARIEAGDHNLTQSAVGSSHFWSSNSNGLNLNHRRRQLFKLSGAESQVGTDHFRSHVLRQHVNDHLSVGVNEGGALCTDGLG